MPTRDPAARKAIQRRADAKRNKTLDRLADHIQGAADLPEPPSRDSLMRALGMQAREGNVSAIRLLLEEYRRDGEDTTEAVASHIDRLAQRAATERKGGRG